LRTLYRWSTSQLVALILLVAVSFGLASTVFAAHESNNDLTFAPVANSPSPNASGQGTINYIKGLSGEEPNTNWASTFQFAGLEPNTMYTIVVQGRFADPAAFSGICTFSTNNQGNGSCQNRFTSLQRLGVAQLRLGGEGGTVVLEARRASGSIVSSGACREAPQVGCEAPGLNK
jgi:hypothetical protein